MLKNNKDLIVAFETERWLYIEGSLDQKRREFWDDRIKNNEDLKKLLSEIKTFNINMKDKLDADLDDNRFELLIDKVFEEPILNSRELIINRIVDFTNGSLHFYKNKWAVIGSFAVILIGVLILFKSPGQNAVINPKFLVWNDTSFSKELNSVELEISDLKNNRIKQYINYQLINDKWFREVVSIKFEIDKLKESTKNKSL